VVAGRQGKTRSLDVIVEVLRGHRMLLADSVEGLAYDRGQINMDQRAMKSAWSLEERSFS